MKKTSFNFPLIDLDGVTQPAQGLLGTFGFSETYRGSVVEEDEFIIALRAENRTERQSQLIQSFAFAWLTRRSKKLGDVIAQAIQLPPSIHYISRIGMLDRTTETIFGGATVVAGLTGGYLFLDGIWELLPTSGTDINPAAWMAADFVLFAIPESIFGGVKEAFGEFGTPIARADFKPEVIFNFLQLCHLYEILTADQKSNGSRLEQLLQQRIVALFISISRMSEGLMLSGESEALAALGGQTAIALGLHEISSHEEILSMIEQGIKTVKDERIVRQVSATLVSVRESMKVDTQQVRRELDRQLVSSMATEATNLAAQPVKLTLDLLGMMVGGLTYITPDATSSKVVSLVKDGIKQTSSAVDATPDFMSKVMQSGIATESWVRNLVRVPWRSKNDDQS